MSDRCPRCGGGLPLEAAFCPTCGQPAGSSPPAEHPAPERPPVDADPPPAAALPPAAGQAPPDAGPGPVAPPQPLSGRSTAIVLGAMALLFVLALAVVLAGPGATKVPTTTTTTVGSQPTPPSSSPPNDPAPTGGSLRSQVEQQVGPFQLQAVKDAPDLLGANERLEAVYRSASGVNIRLYVGAYPSAADAERDRQGWKRLFEEKGYKQVEENPVRSTSGAELGTVSVHRSQTEVVAWTNANLSVLATGPIDQAVAFYKASSY
jgi:hypothetical protein